MRIKQTRHPSEIFERDDRQRNLHRMITLVDEPSEGKIAVVVHRSAGGSSGNEYGRSFFRGQEFTKLLPEQDLLVKDFFHYLKRIDVLRLKVLVRVAEVKNIGERLFVITRGKRSIIVFGSVSRLAEQDNLAREFSFVLLKIFLFLGADCDKGRGD